MTDRSHRAVVGRCLLILLCTPGQRREILVKIFTKELQFLNFYSITALTAGLIHHIVYLRRTNEYLVWMYLIILEPILKRGVGVANLCAAAHK